jgi:hypothetical protein
MDNVHVYCFYGLYIILLFESYFRTIFSNPLLLVLWCNGVSGLIFIIKTLTR